MSSWIFGLRRGPNRSARCRIYGARVTSPQGDDGCAKDSALRARLCELYCSPGGSGQQAAAGDGAASRRGQHGAGTALAARRTRREGREDPCMDDAPSRAAHEGPPLCINQIARQLAGVAGHSIRSARTRDSLVDLRTGLPRSGREVSHL